MNGITTVKPAKPMKLVAAATSTLRRDCRAEITV
jgi:hypothetical protein